MNGVLAIVLPVFGLIGVGWLAARTRLLGANVGEGLSEYVFSIAVPVLMFRTLATAEIPDASPWGYWLSYFAGVAVVWTCASLAVRRLFGREWPTAIVAGFSTGQGNTVLIGIPLILTALGEAGKVPIFLLLAVHLPLMMTVATLLIEIAERKGRSARDVALGLAGSILRHPIIIGILAGVVWRLSGLDLPDGVLDFVDRIGSTAVPCALIATGMALDRYGIAGDVRVSAMVAALKLVVHPLIFLVLATAVFGLPREWVVAGLLFAACPSGVNAYLVAQRYGTGIRIASSAIALSTALALVTVSLWLAWIGAGSG